MIIQKLLVYDNTTLANYKQWIQGIHDAMNSLGWALAGDAAQMVIANLALPAPIASFTQNTENYRGAWSNAGNSYATGDFATNGGLTYKCMSAIAPRTLTGVTSSAGTTTYSSVTSGDIHAGDTVLVSGFVTGGNNGTFTVATVTGAWGSVTQFTCVTTTQSGTETGVAAARVINVTPPASDLTTSAAFNSHWYAYNYEIWVSQGAASTTNPIYIKFVYWNTSVSTASPGITTYIGTAQTNGVVQGNVITGASFVLIGASGNGTLSGTAGIECDFSGDSDNVSMILYRGYAASRGVTVPATLIVDRARDQSGLVLDTYFTVVSFNNTSGVYQVAFKPTAGGLYPTAAGVFPPIPYTGATNNNVNGLIPPLFVFPLVGYLGNPMLGAIFFSLNDVAEGSLVNAVMYGTSYTFLYCKCCDVANFTNFGVAMRWF